MAKNPSTQTSQDNTDDKNNFPSLVNETAPGAGMEKIVIEQKGSDNSDIVDEPLDIARVVRPFKKHWKEIAATTVAGGLLGLGTAAVKTPVYTATATTSVTYNKTEDGQLAQAQVAMAQAKVKSFTDLATSDAVANQVVQQLGIKDVKAADLAGGVKATNTPNTTNIAIAVDGKTPQEAQQRANAWVKAFDDTVNAQEASQSTLKLVTASEAAEPTSPSAPKKSLYAAGGSLLGLLGGSGYAWVRGRKDKGIYSSREVKNNLDVPIIGTLSENGNELIDPTATTGVAGRNVEEYRALRSELRYGVGEETPKAIVVAEPADDAGEAVVVANLALSYAATGEQVVLIDCDLRNPSLVKKLGLKERSKDLSDVLHGEADINEVVQPYGTTGNIFVLSAGTQSSNPTEILESQAMEQLITQLKQQAVVLLDAPPIIPVSDTAVLSRYADGAIVVLTAEKTDLDDAKASTEKLKRVGAKPLGVVLDQVPGNGKSFGISAADNAYYGIEAQTSGLQSMKNLKLNKNDEIAKSISSDDHDIKPGKGVNSGRDVKTDNGIKSENDTDQEIISDDDIKSGNKPVVRFKQAVVGDMETDSEVQDDEPQPSTGVQRTVQAAKDAVKNSSTKNK